jgi:3D (Asp-Asp-Asp) domain-containing protein
MLMESRSTPRRLSLVAFIWIAGMVPGVAWADTQILVGQCVGFLTAPCSVSQSPTPWSHTLTSSDLQSLGLGSETILQVRQTSPYVIRLGVTNITFATPAGSVSQSVPEFNGSYHDPCTAPCETDTVGTISIPANATSASLTGTFGNSIVPNSADVDLTLNGTAPAITLSRLSLTGVQATGMPAGGHFDYTRSPTSGSTLATIDYASGVTPTTNPNTTVLTDPAAPGAPTPGGIANITATYATTRPASKMFSVPTFGMSCYTTALESDWGAPPGGCVRLRIGKTTYAGPVKDPNGLTGTYCKSFIAEVKLQGSATLNSGQNIQYNVTTDQIVFVQHIKGSDGTPVVAGQTVARDYAIIPAKGVRVDLNTIGNGLLANDSGGKIIGYRLDLYGGPGDASCVGFANPIVISACETPQPSCPGSALP